MTKSDVMQFRMAPETKDFLRLVAGDKNISDIFGDMIHAEIDRQFGRYPDKPISQVQVMACHGLAGRARLCRAYLLACEGREGYTLRQTWRETTVNGQTVTKNEWLVIAPDGQPINSADLAAAHEALIDTSEPFDAARAVADPVYYAKHYHANPEATMKAMQEQTAKNFAEFAKRLNDAGFGQLKK